MTMNFKEYTRMRDIVRKRNLRLAEQGLAAEVHFPTVKEIKAGYADYGQALRAVKGYLSEGSTVKAVKQTGIVPDVISFPVMPQEKKLSTEEQRQRKRAADRRYRQRQRLRQEAVSPEMAKKHVSYLRALETVAKTWKKQGFDIGIDLSKMTPKEAQAFVEYMDYRFSQGDFTATYVIDEFIQDFSKLKRKGYKGSDILQDFDKFLAKRGEIELRADNMTGMLGNTAFNLWDEFIRR